MGNEIVLTCKNCGKKFMGTKVTQARQFCDKCRKQRHNDRTRSYYHQRILQPKLNKSIPQTITCIDCGAVVEGKPWQKYCPACKILRKKSYQRKHAREDYLQDEEGNLLVKNQCKVCKKEFFGKYNTRYCENCRKIQATLRFGETKQEEMKRNLTALIQAVEDRTNYYAMFGKTLENCAIARDRNLRLFDEEIISDEEFQENARRIDEARKQAIIVHGEWIIAFMERTKTQHTVRTFVSSIYSDVFGTEVFKEFLKNQE